MRSAPTLNSWMTPFSSVAMLEKLALFRIAFCKAPVLSTASTRRISMTASALAASRAAESWPFLLMDHLRRLGLLEHGQALIIAPTSERRDLERSNRAASRRAT